MNIYRILLLTVGLLSNPLFASAAESVDITACATVTAADAEKFIGAALDVTSVEPLPKDSRLWDMDNVILSPHVSGNMENYMDAATKLFCDNIRRYLQGKKLRNVVDRKNGY